MLVIRIERIESLIKFIEMLSWPTAISIISSSFATSRNIELTRFGVKKELFHFTSRIALLGNFNVYFYTRDFAQLLILIRIWLAKLGPTISKYLQKGLAISSGSGISWESALNTDGKLRI